MKYRYYLKEERKIKKINNHPRLHLLQLRVNLRKKNMIVVAAIAVLAVIVKILGNNPKMNYSVAAVLYL